MALIEETVREMRQILVGEGVVKGAATAGGSVLNLFLGSDTGSIRPVSHAHWRWSYVPVDGSLSRA